MLSLYIPSPTRALPESFSGVGRKDDICARYLHAAALLIPAASGCSELRFNQDISAESFKAFSFKKKKVSCHKMKAFLPAGIKPAIWGLGFSDPPKKARPIGVRGWQLAGLSDGRHRSSALVSLKIDGSWYLNIHGSFKTLLLPPPTVHFTDSKGKITTSNSSSSRTAAKLIYIFLAELFLISVLAKAIQSNRGWETFGSRTKPNSVSESRSDPPAS